MLLTVDIIFHYESKFQLLDAVSFIHSKGFAHLGIRKDKILLTQRGNVKLTDFDTCISLNSNNHGYFVSYNQLQRKCEQIYWPPEIEKVSYAESEK